TVVPAGAGVRKAWRERIRSPLRGSRVPPRSKLRGYSATAAILCRRPAAAGPMCFHDRCEAPAASQPSCIDGAAETPPTPSAVRRSAAMEWNNSLQGLLVALGIGL